MKKLLIVSGIASAIALTGCATQQSHGDMKHTHKDGYHHHHKGDKKDMHHHHHHHKDGKYDSKNNHLFQAFQCENNTNLTVHYLPSQDKAMTHINAPAWKLDGIHIDMQAAPAASGQRFENTTNPASHYEWHSKGDIGVLSVTTGNQTHSVNCEKTEFKHPEFKHPKAHDARYAPKVDPQAQK